MANEFELKKTLNVDTGGVVTIVIEANVAHLQLTTADASELRAEVTISSREESQLAQCAASELRGRRDGDTLTLAMTQPPPGQRCRQRWAVVIPRGVNLTATVEVGDIEARLAGGYGDIELDTAVGNASLSVDGRSVGASKRNPTSESIRVDGDGAALRLHSNVGDVTAAVTRD